MNNVEKLSQLDQKLNAASVENFTEWTKASDGFIPTNHVHLISFLTKPTTP